VKNTKKFRSSKMQLKKRLRNINLRKYKKYKTKSTTVA